MSKKSPKGAGRSAAKPAAAVPPAAAAKPAPAAPPPAPAASKPAAPPTHEQIARLAHDLWAQRGRPSGQDIDIWCEAERRLTKRP